MGKRKHLIFNSKFFQLICIIAITLFNYSSYSSAWLPLKGKSELNYAYSSNCNISILAKQNFEIYHSYDKLITQKYLEIEQLYNYREKNYLKITDESFRQIKEIKEQEIAFLKLEQKQIANSLQKKSVFFSYEEGIRDNLSAGFKADLYEQMNYKQNRFTAGNLHLFSKIKLKETKNKIASFEPGLFFDERIKENTPKPQLTLNFANVKKKLKSKVKFINQYSISTILNFNESKQKGASIIGRLSKSIELKNGVSFTLGEYFSYNPHYDFPYRFFRRHQFTLAKKIKFDNYTNENSREMTLSCGLFLDYLHKHPVLIGNGVYFGLGFKF